MEKLLNLLFDEILLLRSSESRKLLNISEDHLSNPDTTQAYIKRFQSWNKLVELASTIPSLIEQTSSEPLVGFLGHFSSGKSSLINALLKLDSELGSFERPTSQHPTDTGITIIIEGEKREIRELKTITKLSNVALADGPINNSLLSKMSLVDTPGLGNSELEELLVLRFLHLCHILVITIDGRRPFADTEKDFNLLDRSFNYLRGVPKIIAITSAEEFLTDRRCEFETHFDTSKAERFWEDLLSRVTGDERFKDFHSVLTETPYFFVDSKEGYQVDKIRDEILKVLDDEKELERTQVAKHKYILENSSKELSSLSEFVNSRLKKLDTLTQNTNDRAIQARTLLIQLRDKLIRNFNHGVSTLNAQLSEALPVPLNVVVSPEILTQTQQRKIENVSSSIKTCLDEAVSQNAEEIYNWARNSIKLSEERINEVSASLIEKVAGEAFSCLDTIDDLTDDISSSCQKWAEKGIATHYKTVSNKRYSSFDISTIRNQTEYFISHWNEFHTESMDYIRSVVAYVTQPQSLELLREHGFVSYNEDGELQFVEDPFNISVDKSATEIVKISEESIESIKSTKWTNLTNEIESEFSDLGSVQVNIDLQLREQYRSILGGFFNRAREIVASAKKQEVQQDQVFRNNISEIWAANRIVLSRVLAILVLFFVSYWAFRFSFPVEFRSAMNILNEHFLAFTLTTFSTLIIMAIAYTLTGSTNGNVKQVLGFSIVKRLKRFMERRANLKSINQKINEEIILLRGSIGRHNVDLQGVLISTFQTNLNQSDRYKTYQSEIQSMLSILNEKRAFLAEFKETYEKNCKETPERLYSIAENLRTGSIKNYLSDVETISTDVRSLGERLKSIIDQLESAS
jgi:predicted GTPase/serine protease inhibitor